MPSPDDIYVSSSIVRRFGLRTGDRVVGLSRAPKDQEKYWGLARVDTVNEIDPELARRRPNFDSLVPVFPDEMFNLETDQKNLTQRLINLIAPIGKGQRGLILSPAKAGKTTVLKNIAHGITDNHPDALLMVALIGERPEEVTDMQRSVQGEIYASTFDEPTENHTRVAEMTLEIAKRQVETGRDVVILLDSITRLARAYNLALPASGKTLSGGVDPAALYPPKRFFGAARNIEGGGSLTVIATCLVDTGSRMDDVIYEEFKGTGNMELVLDRKLSEKRIFPALDVLRSGTRREELLLDENTLKMIWTMRRMLSAVGPNEGIELLMQRLGKTKNNSEFLVSLSKSVEASEGR
jgi:transcription termination factor Rho